jgi:hypothetical protein
MAKAKSGSFYIRREVDCSSTTPDVVTIDTSAYVDPADRQGIMVQSVDFIFYDSSTNIPFTTVSTDRGIGVQLLTGAYTTLQPYDEEDLVASGGYVVDGGGGVYNAANLYPDVLGSQDGRIVVDDNMSLIGAANAAAANAKCAILIKAKVVTLTNKDYMALALQTVAN